MSDLSIFRFDGADVRTVVIDGEPWFVATDIAKRLGYRDAADMTRTLDEDEKGSEIVRTPGGPQLMNIINEYGLYRAVVKRELGYVGDSSERLAVRAFQRWVTHDVIPSIRKSGQYVAPVEEAPEHLMARALIQAQGIIERKDVAIAALTPRAEAWDELASAEGDYEVADAAKILARAGVETGRTRLFNQLNAIGWIYRSPQGKWKARQTAVDSGYLREKPQSHHHPRTGELVLDPPQVRVTIKGLERLRVRLGKLHAVEVAS